MEDPLADLAKQLEAARREVYAITGVREYLDVVGAAGYRAAASKAGAAINAQADADLLQRLREALAAREAA